MKKIAEKSFPLTPVLLGALLAITLSACVSNQSKSEAEAAPTKAEVKTTESQAVSATDSKPVCKEGAGKSKNGKTKAGKGKAAAAPADCVPAGKADQAQAAPSSTGAYDLSKNKPVTDSTKVEAGQGTLVKGINDWQGEISGVPARNSRFTKLRIGMSQQQATDLVGQPTDQGAYVTGKAFIPFYYGSDKTRWEMVYKGQGRLIFSNQAGFGSGHYLTWIIHNASEGGYR